MSTVPTYTSSTSFHANNGSGNNSRVGSSGGYGINKLYKEISDYFSGFMLTKIGNNSGFSVYYAKIDCQLCADIRYIVAMTSLDLNELRAVKPLSEIQWISFQTRTTTDRDHEFSNMKLKSYPYKRNKLSDALQDKIELYKRMKDKSVYIAENYPVKIELIHTISKEVNEALGKMAPEYSDDGTIASALETYQCVLVVI